ncbi:helix-turn-helix domain-containing protein [Curtanaerobium respiraculi]|uniref:helix-turn-helix domain-containing protein n=1 Tax=Curtanaerobium respiraculi TaxID=2949669 RepID=UPI0024B3832F|nr:AraC family transcriptional regulator [Curtanaerobium respiraculi]
MMYRPQATKDMLDNIVSEQNSSGDHMEVVTEGSRSILRISNETGSGTMLFHNIFPGIAVSFNDFHMQRCVTGVHSAAKPLCIDHCREGRMEQPLHGGTYVYVEKGDLKLDDRSHHEGVFELPLSRYRGISVSYDPDEAQASIDKVIGAGVVSLAEMKNRFCVDGMPMVLHEVQGAEHIFSEMYAAPEGVLDAYLRVKTIELALFLEGLVPNASTDRRPYLYRSQVEKVRAARDLMVDDLTREYTIAQLAERFNMPTTAFKACFRGVYGMPPATYLRAYRMQQAADMLMNTSLKIADVAASVGYGSASKFTQAFRDVMGATPSSWRKTQHPYALKQAYGGKIPSKRDNFA